MTAYEELASFILPPEVFESFELVKTESRVNNGQPELHMYLNERAIPPSSDEPLQPNGFFDESSIVDFPIRRNRTVLHVRRRRWKDSAGRNHSKDWKLVAKGTRISQDFATFLKGIS